MRLAFTFSVEQGLCPADDAARVQRHLAEVGLPSYIADIQGAPPTPEELMAQDKKVKGGKLALVVTRGIGETFVERNVDMEDLTGFLKKECTGR
jgi:3-dehydroquinate synthase